MGFGGGSLLSAGGAVLGYESNQQNNHDQRRAATQYKKAFNDYDYLSRMDENGLTSRLSGLTDQRYAADGALSSALTSPDRLVAGDRAGNDMYGRMNMALSGFNPGTTSNRGGVNTGGGFGNWSQAAQAYNQPKLSAQAGAIAEGARQTGFGAYDQQAYNNLAQTQADIGRQSNEAQTHAQLMQSMRDRMLNKAAMKYKYQGPSAGYYNTQLISGLAQVAGQGMNAHSAYQQPESDPIYNTPS